MAKKDKPEETPSSGLTVVTEAAPPITAYREVTEGRILKVTLTPKEREGHITELTRSVEDIQSLEREKAASSSSFSTRIKEKQARQSRLSVLIQDGWEERSVKCKWLFETSGKDSEGKVIYHPEHKTLVREDTGEVVEVLPMTQSDFNDHKELAIGGNPESEDDTDME